jgi:endonuclease/exonuclease/phosphatase family metal-dependent hydrolase
MDGRVSTGRIGQVLHEVDGDIVALQEVTGPQAEILAAELAMPSVFGENRRYQGDPYGNAVLSRLPIRGWRNYDLSVTGREERGCLRVDLDTEQAGLHVFNVHLGTSHGERRHQARKLLADDLLADITLQQPRIVLGDFNEWTRGLTTELLRSHMKTAAFTGRSYPGLLPFLHLDHIYYDESLELIKLTLHRSARALVASDHLPLVGDYEWGGVGGAAGRETAQKENGSK